MAKELSILNSSMESVATMDFEKVFTKAVEIFADQAMLDKKPEEVDIKELEISKAKANNFLAAISGVIEISHQVEVLSAENDKFKRKDELAILHSLRRSCEMSAKTLEGNMQITQEKLTAMQEDIENVEPDQIFTLQTVMHSNIDAGQKLIGSISRLIQLERLSGSRPWGASKQGSLSLSLIKGLDGADEGGDPTKAPRELTPEELGDIDV